MAFVSCGIEIHFQCQRTQCAFSGFARHMPLTVLFCYLGVIGYGSYFYHGTQVHILCQMNL